MVVSNLYNVHLLYLFIAGSTKLPVSNRTGIVSRSFLICLAQVMYLFPCKIYLFIKFVSIKEI